MAGLTSNEIVTASVAALSGKTAAGTRVYPFKTTPVQNDQLPCLVVSAVKASEDSRSLTDAIFTVTTVITVECHVKASDDATWSSDVDSMTLTVKRALLKNKTWADMFRDISKLDTTIGFSSDNEYHRITAVVEFYCVHDVEYEELEDEELDIEKVHYTDTGLLPQEMEASLTQE